MDNFSDTMWVWGHSYYSMGLRTMKIFLLKQGITDDTTLQQGISFVISKCASIGFPLEFTQTVTTKQFTSVPFNNETNSNGYEVNPTEIFQEAKLQGYQPTLDSICALAYNWNTIKPQPTNPADNGQVIQLPENWYNGNADVMCEFFLHELCHYLFSAVNLPDVVHAYPPAFGQKSRTDYYLWLLTTLEDPFNALLNPATPIKPNVTITRLYSDKVETQGILRVPDNSFGCDTLENLSAQIPNGTYVCKWKFMLRQLTYHYQLQNVKGRSGIFIHSLNYWWQSIGCIGIGSLPKDLNSDGENDLQNSKLILNAFEQKFNKRDFTLLIQ